MSASLRIASKDDPRGKPIEVYILLSPSTVLPKLQAGEYFTLYECRANAACSGPGYASFTKLAAVSVEPDAATEGRYIIRITAKTPMSLRNQYRKALRYLGVEIPTRGTKKEIAEG